MKTPPKSVCRFTHILNFIAKSPSAPSPSEIFKHLQLPRSSGYDLLNGLNDWQYLRQRPSGHWCLGDEIDRLGLSRFGIARLAGRIDPVLAALHEETQASAHFGILHQGALLTTHAAEGTNATGFLTGVGTRVPLNWTAAGRLLVSELSDHQLWKLFTTCTRASPTGRAVTVASVFKRQVQDAAMRGFAIELEEAQAGKASISSPVRDPAGRCIAAVTLVFPVTTLLSSRDTLVALVCSAATRLSNYLGRYDSDNI